MSLIAYFRMKKKNPPKKPIVGFGGCGTDHWYWLRPLPASLQAAEAAMGMGLPSVFLRLDVSDATALPSPKIAPHPQLWLARAVSLSNHSQVNQEDLRKL